MQANQLTTNSGELSGQITAIQYQATSLASVQIQDLRKMLLYENKDYILIRKCDIDHLTAGPSHSDADKQPTPSTKKTTIRNG